MYPLKEIENEILADAKNNFSGTVYKLWFSELRVEKIDMETESILFSTDQDFKRRILLTTYRDFLTNSIESVCGYSFQFDFTVRPKENAEDGQTDEHKDDVILTEPEPVPEKAPEDPKPENPENERQNDGNGRKETTVSPLESPSIIKSYTFDNFIVGASNKFAYAACQAVANRCGDEYNPLFIYGQSGLGKTHLLCAITNQMLASDPRTRLVYKKGESFTNELIASIQDGTTTAFREKYRSADVLLIDDIQFIAGKEATQEEFFHTFSALYEAGKQIILTSDRPPKDIKTLEERLRTRFEWGIIADIQPPSFELRVAIIKKKSEDSGLGLTPEAIDFMATRLTHNVRQIEGALKKLVAVKTMSGNTLNMDKVRAVVEEISSGEQTPEEIVDAVFHIVSKKYGVSIDDIKSSKRNTNIAAARHVCVYLIRQLTDYSLEKIGAILHRDHTTVLSSNLLIEEKIRKDSSFESEINEMIEQTQK